jgi:hypothetical protein
MAKKHKNKGMGFAVFMIVYAVLALGGIGLGLKWFWGFMEAYEASRPHIPIDAYMEKLTRDHIVENCDVIIEKADINIQSREECMNYLYEAVSGELSCARKASACTETRQTYVIRSGDRVVGSFVIESGMPDKYGFVRWTLKEESFDLSDLMGTETVSTTVPESYTVYVNGVQLDESYITAREKREYQVLEEFYGSYELPEQVMVTYQAGPFLNAQYEMEVYDHHGKPFTMDESFDETYLITLIDEERIDKVDDFLDTFLDAYVLFSGCANDNRHANYKNVIRYVVPESKLAQRMEDALDGLQFAQSRGDEVAEMQVNNYIELPEGRYMVDVTYKVNTIGYEGMVQTTTNVKMILVTSGDKLLVESMIGY